MTSGRPLRFLALLLFGWAGARGIAIYRDTASGPERTPGRWIAPIGRLIHALDAPAAAATLPHSPRSRLPSLPPAGAPHPSHQDVADRPIGPRTSRFAPVTVHEIAGPPQRFPVAPPLSPVAMPPPIARSGARLAGSAWLIARDGATVGLPGSQLGGSQAGVRVTYALGDARRFALAARVSAPLSGRGREAALGVDWQPTRLPVHVIAEQRFGLDGGRGGPTLGIVGGFGPAQIAPGVRMDGYGQAGVIARDGGQPFADGAIRASHPLAALGVLRIDVGAGAWGGVQRGAARLDVGPSLGATIPLGGRAVRLTADWRQRIAGASRPGSGPALSVGTNF